MDFGCEACEHVTIFRVGRKPDGSFRFFIAEGSALDKPKQFNGTSVVVKTVESAKDVVYGTVKGGWEPHFVVVYGQVANELEKLGNMLGVEVCKLFNRLACYIKSISRINPKVSSSIITITQVLYI